MSYKIYKVSGGYKVGFTEGDKMISKSAIPLGKAKEELSSLKVKEKAEEPKKTRKKIEDKMKPRKKESIKSKGKVKPLTVENLQKLDPSYVKRERRQAPLANMIKEAFGGSGKSALKGKKGYEARKDISRIVKEIKGEKEVEKKKKKKAETPSVKRVGKGKIRKKVNIVKKAY